jgi:hypothetical protein
MAGVAPVISGALIETLRDPLRYSRDQLDLMCRVASWLNRGRLLVFEEPDGRKSMGGADGSSLE